MLAKARQYQPALTQILMSKLIYNKYNSKGAVPEPTTAGDIPPTELTEDEKRLYLRLLSEEKGRLEQEFLSKDDVAAALSNWTDSK